VEIAVQPKSEDVPALLVTAMPSRGWRGWIGPLAVTVVAAVLRLWNLGLPHAVIFDETYYPKDALSLLRFGYERVMVDKANDILLGSNGNWHTLGIFGSGPEFVVHPPLGKWTIAVGEFLFGATPFGWRIAVCVLGIATVLMTARIARRLTRSDLVGTLAGGFLAIDGIHLVMSRTGLLDMVLTFWVLAAFGLLVVDRDRTRARMAAWVAVNGLADSDFGPRLGFRPLRWAAALCLGLACGVKWSGIYFLVAFIILTVVWDIGLRRAIGVRMPWRATILRDLPISAVSMFAVAVAAYVSTWTGWLATSGGWDRTWADSQPGSIIPAALRSLWHYHAEAWHFHIGLDTPHAYSANPLGWAFMARPTSFYWLSVTDHSHGCTVSNCAAEVVALGNPILWWGGVAAMVYMLWRWLARRDWRAAAIMVGIAAGWLPWMLYLNRTIFTFYTVVYSPFVMMAVALTCGAIIGPTPQSATDSDDPDRARMIAMQQRRRRIGALAAGAFVVAAVVAAWWFYPVWTGQLLPYDSWHLRMWSPTWV